MSYPLCELINYETYEQPFMVSEINGKKRLTFNFDFDVPFTKNLYSASLVYVWSGGLSEKRVGLYIGFIQTLIQALRKQILLN